MIELRHTLHARISSILAARGVGEVRHVLEFPADPAHGDLASNAAMVAAKPLGMNPKALAEEFVRELREANDSNIASIDVAGPGFINIRLSDSVLHRILDEAGTAPGWGTTKRFSGKKVIIEYTDPNPFKEFHIGHLMPNTIGEALARIIAAGGAEVRRVNYQGDVGMHVAMAIWGMMHHHEEMPSEEAPHREQAAFLGKAYAKGAKAFQEDPAAKEAITRINRQVYERSDPLVRALYDNGRRWSLEYFEDIYRLLGTRFDHYFFESETAELGRKIVEAHPDVFERSNGAVVFPGEKYGLHTRVFVNQEGLPTYEAKELGLAKMKYDLFPYDLSIIVTANEIVEYFKVLLKAMELVYQREQLSEKTKHIAHGIMRLSGGKLSSRTGNVITALSLIDDAKEEILPRIDASRGFTEEERQEIAEKASIGALKFTILRQEIGKDIVFDYATSLSFDGDSGPYLQYTLARLRSLLAKAKEANEGRGDGMNEAPEELERLIARYPAIILRAQEEFAPHHITQYLVGLARAFNAYYGRKQIVGVPESGYRVRLAEAIARTLAHGLDLLAIPRMERM
jgi:arginyl-tRNA synthetase